MQFGDFLVMVTVWLVCHVVVFGHPSASKNELPTPNLLRISEELESIPEESTHRPVLSESELFEHITKVILELYKSELLNKSNYEPMQGDQPLLNGSNDQSSERLKEIHQKMMKES